MVEVQSKHNKTNFISQYGGTELTTTFFGLLHRPSSGCILL